MKKIIYMLFIVMIFTLLNACTDADRTNKRPEDSPYSTHGESQRIRNQNNITSEPSRPRRW